MALKLEVAGRLGSEIDKPMLESALNLINKSVLSPDGLVNLKLVDDAEIRALNKKYAGNDKATDVLSFNYAETGDDHGELGDIAISRQTAIKQSEAAGTDLKTEVTLLFIHGVLHLLGYDHATPAEQAEMESLQAKIMTGLKLTYRDFKWDSSAA